MVIVALGFTLSLMAFLSLLLLRFAVSRVEVTVEPVHLRTFKNEHATGVVRVRSRSSRWARLSPPAVRAPFGLACDSRQLDPETIELQVTPRFAGRFTGVTVRSELGDALGLFRRTEEVVAEELTVESLPRSLLAPPARIAVSPLTSGESPAGRRGMGQELYAVEEYQRGLDAKDILWRRVAASSNDRMLSRVREANVKALLRIGVAVGWSSEEERVRRLDLVSEAVGTIGAFLLSFGVSIEMVFPSRDGLATVRASKPAELASATTAPSEMAQPPAEPDPRLLASDLVILGPQAGPEFLARLGRRRVLIVSEMQSQGSSAPLRQVFTGYQDLATLAREMLEG